MHLGRTALDEALDIRGRYGIKVANILRANGEHLLNFLHFI